MRGQRLKSEMMRVFQEFFAAQPIEDSSVKVICILSLGTINITNALNGGWIGGGETFVANASFWVARPTRV